MKAIEIMLRGSLRKNKGAYISVSVLMLIVSLSLAAVLTLMGSAKKRDTELVEACGMGNLMAFINIRAMEEQGKTPGWLAQELRDCTDLVERVDEIPALYMNIYDLNGDKSSSSCMLLEASSAYVQYGIYDDRNRRIEQMELKPGEIIVPVCFRTLYSCELGDTLYLGNAEKSYPFTVAAWFEDPYMGSALMGIKTLLISSSDRERLLAENGQTVSEAGETEQEIVGDGVVISVFKKASSGLSDIELERELNRRTSYTSYSWINLSRSQAISYMLIFTNVFSGIVMVFIVLLVVITMIVLSRNIGSSLELGYEDYGVLKAIGVPGSYLKHSVFLSYLGSCVLGALLGMAFALPVIAWLNAVLRPIIGLYLETALELPPVLASLCGIFLLIGLLLSVKLRKIRRITPVQALRQGDGDVHFSSLLKLPIGKRLLSVSLAWRQFVSGKKQYLGAIVITALLGFFLILASSMSLWAGDGKAMAEIFSCQDFQLECVYADSGLQEEVEALIRERTEFASYHQSSQYLLLDDAQLYCYISDAPEHYNTVYKGRTCTYENEVMMTPFVAEGFGLSIGDSVELSLNGQSAEFIVSGFYQSANDTGKNIAINADGYRRLTGKDYEFEKVSYCLADPDADGELLELITERYTDSQVKVRAYRLSGDMDFFVDAVYAVTALVYVITAIFVMITVLLICDRMFAKEQRDYGIYKSVGFTQLRLRNQFALRFVLVSLLGSLLGVALSVLLGDLFVGTIFASFGLGNVRMDLELGALLLPVLFTALLYYLFSFLVSRKIRRVQPRILVVE